MKRVTYVASSYLPIHPPSVLEIYTLDLETYVSDFTAEDFARIGPLNGSVMNAVVFLDENMDELTSGSLNISCAEDSVEGKQKQNQTGKLTGPLYVTFLITRAMLYCTVFFFFGTSVCCSVS